MGDANLVSGQMLFLGDSKEQSREAVEAAPAEEASASHSQSPQRHLIFWGSFWELCATIVRSQKEHWAGLSLPHSAWLI